MKNQLRLCLFITLFFPFFSYCADEIWTIPTTIGSNKSIYISGDNSIMLTTDVPTMKLIDIKAGEMKYMKESPQYSIADCKISGDNKFALAIVKLNDNRFTMMKYSLESLAIIETYEFDSIKYSKGKILPGMRHVALLTSDNTLYVRDFISWELIYKSDNKLHWAYDFDFTADEQYVVFANQENIQKIKFPEDSLIFQVYCPNDINTDVYITSDDKYIVIGFNSGKKEIYDFQTGKLVKYLKGPFKTPVISYSPELERMISINSNTREIIEWNIKDSSQRVLCSQWDSFARYAEIDGKLYIIHGKNDIKLMDYESLSDKRTLIDSVRIFKSAFAGFNDEILLFDAHCPAAVHDVETGKFIRKISGELNDYYPDKKIYTIFEENADSNVLKLMDYQSDSLLESYKFPKEDYDPIFSGDIKRLKFFSFPLIKLMDWQKKEIIWAYDCSNIDKSVNQTFFSPDNQMLALCGANTFQILNINDTSIIFGDEDLQNNNIGSVQFFMFNKDFAFFNKRKAVAILDSGNLARIFNLETRTLEKELDLNAPGEEIIWISISPDDKAIICKSSSNTVYIFNIADGEQMMKYHNFDYAITDIKINAEMDRMAIIYWNSALSMLNIDGILGVCEPEQVKVNLPVYPNPCGDRITIKTSEISGVSTVKIYDMLGCEKYSAIWFDGGQYEIDVSGFPAGAYNAVIYSGERVFTEKFIKMK